MQATEMFKEELIWKLNNYKNAYLDMPKKDWPVYEFVYRSVLRYLIDDFTERFRKDDNEPFDILQDFMNRFDDAVEEEHGSCYKVYRDATKELMDIVVFITEERNVV